MSNPLSRFNSTVCAIFGTLALLIAAPISAQFTVPSDGSDGVLNVTTADLVIDLGLASTGAWNSTPVQPGSGVYDPDQWIVVFKYQSVNIASGRTVKFKNHPKNPPVVWLVQGDVVINGRLDLSGSHGFRDSGARGNGGPGGFSGGTAVGSQSVVGVATSGFGLGGGLAAPNGAAGTHLGSLPYANAACFPLIGGSGGAAKRTMDWVGNTWWWPNGGGGGAILIASPTSIQVGASNGAILANGGGQSVGQGNGPWEAGGSGGMVRLAAPMVTGGGLVQARSAQDANGLPAGFGRIRIEANSVNVNCLPAFSSGSLGSSLRFLRDSATPTVRVVSVNSIGIPSDPLGIGGAGGETPVVASSNLSIVLECANVPSNATVTVRVNAADTLATTTLNATFTSGNTALSTWTATGSFGLTQGAFAVQARAVLP